MIRVAFLSRPGLMDPMKPLLERELPGVAVASWPEPAARDADIAVCWKPDAGALAAISVTAALVWFLDIFSAGLAAK